MESEYPAVVDPALVGTYDGDAKSGGGYVWDDVLEYRVWCHPHDGAEDLDEGSDFFCSFATFEEALEFSRSNAGTADPIALIRQAEYIDEPSPGHFVHCKTERLTEWPVELLKRPRRNEHTIPRFFAGAPASRMGILRGTSG